MSRFEFRAPLGRAHRPSRLDQLPLVANSVNLHPRVRVRIDPVLRLWREPAQFVVIAGAAIELAWRRLGVARRSGSCIRFGILDRREQAWRCSVRDPRGRLAVAQTLLDLLQTLLV